MGTLGCAAVGAATGAITGAIAGAIANRQQAKAQAAAAAAETGAPDGFYQDSNGRWHRPNGQFASNAEVGVAAPQSSSSSTSKIHGNSLDNPNTNYGYVLVDNDTGEVLKFGETLYPDRRYSQTYLDNNNASMEVLVSGSKREIHDWQHNQIQDFFDSVGSLPLLNKSFW